MSENNDPEGCGKSIVAAIIIVIVFCVMMQLTMPPDPFGGHWWDYILDLFRWGR